MITASKAFIAFCLLAVGGAVLVIGPTELRRLLPNGAKTDIAAKPEPKADAKVELKKEEPKLAASAPTAPAASPAPETKTGALAETQKQVTAALADLAPVKPPPAVADTGPRFDVARVDDHGEAAVIAGQATPGAKVELLRDGKPIDSVVADASGQFVMTPPQLPAGSYELTLRAKSPDGTVTQSGRSMPVVIAEAAPPPARPAPVARQEAETERRRPRSPTTSRMSWHLYRAGLPPGPGRWAHRNQGPCQGSWRGRPPPRPLHPPRRPKSPAVHRRKQAATG